MRLDQGVTELPVGLQIAVARNGHPKTLIEKMHSCRLLTSDLSLNTRG